MRRGFSIWVTLLTMTLWAATALGVPVIDRAVVDQAGVLSDEAIASLSATLHAHHQATGVQLAILIVPTIGAEPIEDYSLRTMARRPGRQRSGRARDYGPRATPKSPRGWLRPRARAQRPCHAHHSRRRAEQSARGALCRSL
ncbi:MAG: TPM domain-containing protein [Bradymonadaceae bacterium]|nr:TPM domain-containing protein [Lujinxingiaceae bacterium]